MTQSNSPNPAQPDPARVEAAATSPRPAPVRNVTRPADGSPPVGFPDAPGVRELSLSDIFAALQKGIDDFRRAPRFGLFFGGFFALAGLLMMGSLLVWDSPLTVLSLAIAFPLLGPFIAVGLYEVSRRLDAGEPLSWREVLGVVIAQKDRQLAWMGMVVLFVFWVWAYQVRLLLALFLSSSAFSSYSGFIEVITTTQNGLTFLTVGTMIGAVLALVLFSLTVISMPLLVERDMDVATAMVTSVTTVRRNLMPMLTWGVIVTLAMLAAMLPGFAGLLFVLPVLGHATWHIYKRAIVQPAPET
ncbi:MAG: DUF2189 domain-containing protein [Neomegalonema sp.]|nr:DUF2189 domain-containing protein [Neomegalonema sp.]